MVTRRNRQDTRVASEAGAEPGTQGRELGVYRIKRQLHWGCPLPTSSLFLKGPTPTLPHPHAPPPPLPGIPCQPGYPRMRSGRLWQEESLRGREGGREDCSLGPSPFPVSHHPPSILLSLSRRSPPSGDSWVFTLSSHVQ